MSLENKQNINVNKFKLLNFKLQPNVPMLQLFQGLLDYPIHRSQ